MVHDNKAMLKVLVVDDDVDAAASLCSLLRHMGCDTRSAFEIRSALEVAATFKPSVVLLDLEMPGADGCQVLKDMKALSDDLHDAFYVCVTGSSQTDSRRRCEAAGFQRFQSKPLWLQDLTEILGEGRERVSEARHGRKRRRPHDVHRGAARQRAVPEVRAQARRARKQAPA